MSDSGISGFEDLRIPGLGFENLDDWFQESSKSQNPEIS
jgi:hypothetical protein